jgi:hypothetical protein
MTEYPHDATFVVKVLIIGVHHRACARP